MPVMHSKSFAISRNLGKIYPARIDPWKYTLLRINMQEHLLFRYLEIDNNTEKFISENIMLIYA